MSKLLSELINQLKKLGLKDWFGLATNEITDKLLGKGVKTNPQVIINQEIHDNACEIIRHVLKDFDLHSVHPGSCIDFLQKDENNGVLTLTGNDIEEIIQLGNNKLNRHRHAISIAANSILHEMVCVLHLFFSKKNVGQ